MKIVIAPDSFKGSVSALSAAVAISKGLKDVLKENVQTVLIPIADGGEGTLEAIVKPSERITARVSSPDGDKINAEYGFIEDTAVIESAKAAGLTLSKRHRAALATTYGVGELIADALNKGFRKFIITVGGSATNDGGAGMFSALGAKFTDKDNKVFVPTGGTLKDVCDIDLTGVNSAIYESSFTFASDVNNPLCGELGATNVYGAQKGATKEELCEMESGMLNYERIITEKCGFNVGKIEGAGAGGGLPVLFLAFYNAKICSGIEAVLNAVNFSSALKNASAVITGEGKIDEQSLYGKAISGVTVAAKKEGVPVYCFVGAIGCDKKELLKTGIKDIFAISSLAKNAEDSILNAEQYLYQTAKNFAEYNKMNALQ